MENEENNQNQNMQNAPTSDMPTANPEQSFNKTLQTQTPPRPQDVQTQQPQAQEPQVPQTPTPQNISQEPVQPQNNKSNLLLTIGLILLAIAVLAGVISFFLRNRQQNISEKATNMTPVPTQSINRKPSPTPNPTENWKAATALKYYTIKYPPDTVTNVLENTINISYWGPTQTENTELFDGYSITLQAIETAQTPQEYADSQVVEVKSSGASQIIKDPEKITINNYEGVTYTEEGLGTYQQIILRAKNSSVLIQISVLVADPGDLGFQDTVDNILSTITITPGA